MKDQVPDPTPLVSIVIPSGRGPAAAAETVSFALRGSEGVSCEVVVAADGPKWADPPQPVEGARVVRSTHRGPAGTRNSGIRAARGAYIATIDDDCRPRPGWLQGMVTAMADGVGGVGGPVRAYQGKTVFSRFADEIKPLDACLKPGALRHYLVTANCLFRRSALDDVGLFHEGFPFPGGEDLELSQRLLDGGYRLAWAPDAYVDHEFDIPLRSWLRTHYNYGVGTALADAAQGVRVTRLDYTKNFVWLCFHWNPFKSSFRYGAMDRVAAFMRLVGMWRYAGTSPTDYAKTASDAA